MNQYYIVALVAEESFVPPSSFPQIKYPQISFLCEILVI
jgi:hypothetical protein